MTDTRDPRNIMRTAIRVAFASAAVFWLAIDYVVVEVWRLFQ